jgi:hypothetical protein
MSAQASNPPVKTENDIYAEIIDDFLTENPELLAPEPESGTDTAGKTDNESGNTAGG